ncbi:MAG TPA: PLP-dependent aspartate aminotransferase family protein [Acidobacteriota bacterium]|nr:PLP-dependent aspartate aminotransferase family protein [Acidobacteriota bacterium]
MGFSTDAIHAGQKPEPSTGAIIQPIFQTSTYVQQGVGKHQGYEYARTQNPTREALEGNLAKLEGGSHGVAFASGMAAINALMSRFSKGDHFVVSENVYGGTYRLFEMNLRKFGLDFSWVETSNFEALEASLGPNTKMVFLETPTNPTMRLTDLKAAAGLCRSRGILTTVDNTFMSPYLQRPLELGIDIVLHSTTKFLNGHSDSVGGIVITSNEEVAQDLRFIQNAAGAILSPFDSWLVLRGTKTLAVRMRAHEEAGRRLAEFLDQHPKVEKVLYPGLAEHPQHDLAKDQQNGFGSMISFETGSFEKADRMLSSLKLIALAESLGGVESLASHPAAMTHASVPPEERRRLGITDGLARISVGLEDVEDLTADLDQALSRI